MGQERQSQGLAHRHIAQSTKGTFSRKVVEVKIKRQAQQQERTQGRRSRGRGARRWTAGARAADTAGREASLSVSRWDSYETDPDCSRHPSSPCPAVPTWMRLVALGHTHPFEQTNKHFSCTFFFFFFFLFSYPVNALQSHLCVCVYVYMGVGVCVSSKEGLAFLSRDESNFFDHL